MSNFNNFYESWNFLRNHKMCEDKKGRNHFKECLDLEVVKVNPKTKEIDTNETLNTKTEVWLEFGGVCEEIDMVFHDYDLDCGGDTFEEAIINLANLVWENYKDEKEERMEF